jgi:GNAT superfamily N-acetyltransferase
MLEIQRLNSTEGERWRSIRLAALLDAPDAFGTTLAEANAFPPELWSRQVGEFPTFIAVLDGVDVGDVGVVRASPDNEQPEAAFLLSMWVAPDARGKGVGDELIDAVASWAEADGFSRLVLDVADANASAIALYARKGFEPTGDTSTLPSPRQRIREHRRALALPRA